MCVCGVGEAGGGGPGRGGGGGGGARRVEGVGLWEVFEILNLDL